MTSYVLTERIKHDVIDTVYNISLHTTHHRVQTYMHTSTTLICIIHVHIRNIDTPLQLHLGMNRLSQFLFLLLKAVVGYRMTVNASPINPKTVAYAIISQQKRPKATFCIILPAIFSLQKDARPIWRVRRGVGSAYRAKYMRRPMPPLGGPQAAIRSYRSS